jgi:hypothetical protein
MAQRTAQKADLLAKLAAAPAHHQMKFERQAFAPGQGAVEIL